MRTLIFLVVILFGAGCGPRENAGDSLTVNQSIPGRPSENDRLIELDRQIKILEDEAEDENPDVDADLNARIQRDQDMISTLNSEATTEQSTQAEGFAMLQFRQREESSRYRERLTQLAEQVRAQELNLAGRQQAFTLLVAPEDSDLIRQGRADVSGAQQELDRARAEYQSLLAEYQSSPDAYFSDQSRLLGEIRARTSSFIDLISSTQADLNQAVQTKNQITAQRQNREKNLQALQAERAQLSAAEK